ncbi:MAG: hypothetical protein CL608_17220 [Anaerolineaceae bacterium]|nr:hypothetical protein [Anaerolineaceae bacterium]
MYSAAPLTLMVVAGSFQTHKKIRFTCLEVAWPSSSANLLVEFAVAKLAVDAKDGFVQRINYEFGIALMVVAISIKFHSIRRII